MKTYTTIMGMLYSIFRITRQATMKLKCKFKMMKVEVDEIMQ